MRARREYLIRVAVAMLALAVVTGCGGGGGGGGDTTAAVTETPTPSPGQTTTPAPTPTPAGASPVSVLLDLRASTTVIAAGATVTYSSFIGGFTGAGGGTDCSIDSGDMFVANDDGALKIGVNSVTGLRLPATVRCTFNQIAGAVAAGDFTVTSNTIAVLDAGIPVSGDSRLLAITVAIRRTP